jgi:uncharacterized protein (DUF1499 family)
MHVSLLLLTIALTVACADMNDWTLGLRDGRLAPCPGSPNCVSSDATSARHHIAPYRLNAPPGDAWRALIEVVSEQPRATVLESTDAYLYAEFRSRFFGFVDDVEFYLRPEEQTIGVRSASRVGYSDLGANRKRVESIREALRARGAVQ